MKRFDASSWQQRRSEFNHQWLKNRLLSALDSAANLLKGRISGSGYLEGVLEGEVREWPVRRQELTNLLDDFVTDMSPRKLFDIAPLSEWDAEAKQTVGELLHELWLMRYPVGKWVRDAHEAAEAVDEAYALVALGVTTGEPLDPQFVRRFEDFRSACGRLATAIERFPNQVLVV